MQKRENGGNWKTLGGVGFSDTVKGLVFFWICNYSNFI